MFRVGFDALAAEQSMNVSMDGHGPAVLHLNLRHVECGARLELGGELDPTTAEHVVDACRALPRRTAQLDVDLTGLAFLDAAGLRALITAHEIVTDRGGRFRVCGARPRILRVMAITGVDGLLELEPAGGRVPPPPACSPVSGTLACR